MVGKVFIGSDHAGLVLKRWLVAELSNEILETTWEDLGTHSEASCDYPDFAGKVARRVAAGEGRGILVCGSGIGMCMAANKIAGIRAAMAWDATSARLSREHNDANILCLGARLLGVEVAREAVRVWLGTAFLGGRHQGRVDALHRLEGKKG